MIKTVADLLESIRIKEVELLNQQDIKHGPTIGNMYEGLTHSMLDKVLFDGLNLRIVQGFIKNPEGNQSSQIDCMLVEGSGEKLPYSDKYIYPISQVLAVIEVKKTLFSSQLVDAYENLYSVVETIDKTMGSDQELRDAWRLIMRSEIPTFEEVDKLPFEKRMIMHSLLYDHMLPVRVALGYHGFSTEYSLRQAFIDFIDKNALDSNLKVSFGPHCLPSLILSRNNALVKFNGMPYAAPWTNERKWPIYGSLSDRSMLLLLELIWSRLSYRYELGSGMFDDNLECFHHLLYGEPYVKDDQRGWIYSLFELSKTDLEKGPKEVKWEPVEITEAQFEVINYLGEKGAVSVDSDLEFRHILKDRGLDIEFFLEQFKKTGLVFIDNDRNLRFLTDECTTAVLPDGRFIAGENKSNLFFNWLKKYNKHHHG